MKNLSKIQQVIDQAFVAGSKRKPQHFHVLVHPAYPWSEVGKSSDAKHPGWQKQIEQWHASYKEAIECVLAENPNTSVIIRESDPSLHKHFPEAALNVQGHPGDNGYLTRGGMREVLEWMQGLNTADKVSIHGSGWKFCPNEFAFQWSVLKHLQVFAPFKAAQLSLRGSRTRVQHHPYTARLMQQLKRVIGEQADELLVKGVQHNTSYSPSASKHAYAKQEGHLIIPSPEELTAKLPNKVLLPLGL